MGSLYDLLEQRRMVRHYTGEPAPRDALERIVATVRRAPSAGFSQGQRLLAVDDPEVLAQIAALAEDDLFEGLEPWFETAAAHVYVMTREQDYHDRTPARTSSRRPAARRSSGPSRSGTSMREPR